MSHLIKLVILVCAAVAASAGSVDFQNEDDSQTVLLDDLFETFARRDESGVFGQCQPTDKLLYSETVQTRPSILRRGRAEVRYPADHTSQGEIVTCIKYIDNLRTGRNGRVVISSGGIGQPFVVVSMTSRFANLLKYSIEIYGRPR